MKSPNGQKDSYIDSLVFQVAACNILSADTYED